MASSKKARQRKAAKMLNKKKRRKPEEARRLKPLQEKLEKGGFLQGTTLLTNPEGEAKMSDAIEEFMEPYRKMAHNLDEFKNLLGLVILAWNASFIEATERENTIEKLVQSQSIPEEGQEEFRRVFSEMIERKLEHFGDNRRKIVEFDVKDIGEEFYFSVASTLG